MRLTAIKTNKMYQPDISYHKAPFRDEKSVVNVIFHHNMWHTLFRVQFKKSIRKNKRTYPMVLQNATARPQVQARSRTANYFYQKMMEADPLPQPSRSQPEQQQLLPGELLLL